MTAFWTYDNLARVTGGTWLAPPADGGAVLPAAQRDAGPVIWHDTRDLEPGQCYLAVKGENFDGHDFVEQAFENGAALALVNSSTAPQAHGLAQQGRGIGDACPILAVPDTVTALQDLARAYRDELAKGACKVIGVAGSNGKTTTRHLIHHVLTHAGKTGTQSPKSFNNHLGVPLTLLAARPTDDFVACEIGTNHPGEIDFLSAIARPDIAVITSIGEEHLEFFGDIAGVAEEESDILRYVSEGGTAIVPGEKDLQPMLGNSHMLKCPDQTEVHCLSWVLNGYGGLTHMSPRRKPNDAPADPRRNFHFSLIQTQPESDGLSVNRFKYWHWSDSRSICDVPCISLGVPGRHNSYNAAITILVADQLGLGPDVAIEALRTATIPSQRLTEHDFGAGPACVRVVDDTYNANPSSMRESIEMVAKYQGSTKAPSVLVLGDMYELGEDSAKAHRAVGALLATLDDDYIGTKSMCVSRIILIGVAMQEAAEPVRTAWSRNAADRLFCFPNWTDDLPDQVAALLRPGDTVLLKGSRGMRLERLIPAIEKRFGKVESPHPVSET